MARTKQVVRSAEKPPNPRSDSLPTGPNKRPRTDDSEWDGADWVSDDEGAATQSKPHAPARPARTRDGEFWFEDGSVILVAGDVEFRVFKSILAQYSPVFSDMFSPQPSSTPDAPADPCPVVHLCDSPEDLRHILRVSMPKSSTSPFASKPSYHMLSATLRLGHKYQIHNLVKHGVEYLQKWFTSDLDTWEEELLYHEAPFERIYAIGVVNLARLLAEPSLLPTALLACCTLGADVVKGFTREDGTHESLSLDDLGRCFAARMRLAEHGMILAATTFSPPVSDDCPRPQKCREALQTVLAKLKEPQIAENILDADIFSSEVRSLGWGIVGLCAGCLGMIRGRGVEQRQALWKLLPKIMGVDDVLDSDLWVKPSSE